MDQTVQGVIAKAEVQDAGFGQYNLVRAQAKMIPGPRVGELG